MTNRASLWAESARSHPDMVANHVLSQEQHIDRLRKEIRDLKGAVRTRDEFIDSMKETRQ